MSRSIQRRIDSAEQLRPAVEWAETMIHKALPAGPVIVTLGREKRNLEQNAKFHAICDDVARQAVYMGRHLDASQWKVLFVSGHAIATGQGAEVVPGLEGEFVNIRESTANMSRERFASLLEYVLAWCAGNDIELSE